MDSLVPWAEELGISFPAAGDFWPHGEVSQKYNVFIAEDGVPARAIVLVDEGGKICFYQVYPEDQAPPTEPVMDALRELRQ